MREVREGGREVREVREGGGGREGGREGDRQTGRCMYVGRQGGDDERRVGGREGIKQ